MKTGLNDIYIKIEITTSLDIIGLSIRFLQITEHFIIYYEVMGFRIIQVVTFLNMVFLTSCKHVLTSTS